MILGIRWGRLVTKIVAWSFVPTAAVLLGVGLLVMLGAARGAVVGRTFVTALLALLVLGLLVPPLVTAVGARRLTRPIADLIAAAQEVARGHFGRTIAAHTGDEIEILADQFNLMSGELAASVALLERRVADRTRELADLTEAEHRRAEQFRVIAEVGRHITAILPEDELVERIVRAIDSAFGYYHVGIALLEGDEAVYRAGAGSLWSELREAPDGAGVVFRPARLAVGQEGITGWVAGHGQPALVPDVRQDPRYVEMEGSSTRSELAVPMTVGSEVVGVLDVQSDRLDDFDETDLVVIQSLASQAAVAIQNARLYTRDRQLAVWEERQRVARDLHDSVTQSLYAVSLYSDAAARLMAAGDVAQARSYCGQLRDAARDALAEMRLLLFELRPPELAHVGLVAALAARLESVEGRSGLRTSLQADEALQVAPEVEAALFRIAQEALNNSLRHARAANVEVRLHREGAWLVLEAQDDGVGFEPGEDRGGGLGLRGMSERAAYLGGRLVVHSAPGEGTCIRAEIPA